MKKVTYDGGGARGRGHGYGSAWQKRLGKGRQLKFRTKKKRGSEGRH